MAQYDDLVAALADISAEVDKVSADTDTLLAQLAALPPSIDLSAAIATAQGIAARLKTLDDKVPDPAAPPPPTA